MYRRRSINKINAPKRTKPKSTWKVHELKTAKAFGTDRVPLSGMAASLETRSDSFHTEIYFECKYRKEHTIYQVFDIAHKEAKKQNKFPAVLIIRKGYRRHLLLVHVNNIAASYPGDFHTEIAPLKFVSPYSLYLDTVKKAKIENKVPCLSLREKNRKGFLLGFHVGDKPLIQNYYGKEN